MEESSVTNERSVEGTRKKRRERYLSVIMYILKDGEWHSLHDLAYEVKLTVREVAGLLRGQDVLRDDERVKLGDDNLDEKKVKEFEYPPKS